MSPQMTIAAKFQCLSVTTSDGDEHVTLEAVTADGGESNRAWSEATPSGRLELTISNPAAQGKFKPGQCYLLHIEPDPAGE